MNRKFFKLRKIFKLVHKTHYRKDKQNSTEEGKNRGFKSPNVSENVRWIFLSWFTELIISFLGSKNIFSVNLIIYVPKLVHIYCSRKVEQIIQTARPSHACHNYFFRGTYLK